ncbi:MAG: ABC transporter ATP-binding protein [Lachnospiraceae bacterium]|nr:ABC transporter ATP-binding protein [Lachnospiraceae bacterium]
MEEIILEVTGMQKFYHDVQILKGINFQMKKGEFVAIMGASGSGKTTFLNCISAMERFEEGTVKINGVNICKLCEKELAAFRRDKLGFIFQEYNLLDTLTIRENIILPLTLGQKKELVQKVELLAELFQIEHILDKLPTKVSGGERQRCACVRALIKEPSIILADEPTGALDQKASRILMRSMCEMNKKFDTSILMVTHDPFSASYTDRVVFIQDGKITRELCRSGQNQEGYLDEILRELYAEGRNF